MVSLEVTPQAFKANRHNSARARLFSRGALNRR